MKLFTKFILISCLLFLVSCSSSKQIQSSVEKSNVKEKTEESAKINSEVTSLSDKRTISQTQITETCDTLFKDPGQKIGSLIPAAELQSGKHSFSETQGMTLEFWQDSTGIIRGQATEKPSEFKGTFTRTTTKNEVTDQNDSKKENSTTELRKKEQAEKNVESENKIKSVTGWKLPVPLIFLILGAVIIAIVFVLRRLNVF